MVRREVSLAAAAFLDSPFAALPGVAREAAQTIVERFLDCCFTDAGKAPRFLDGHDLHQVLGHHLPARFSRKDPLAAQVPAVLRAYLDHLEQSAVVSGMFELRRALDATLPEFQEAVRTGAIAHHDAGPQQPFVHKAPKLGRNDPCFCGSGKKFKNCCLKLQG